MNNVAILIPHYNNPKGLLKSINSIKENLILDIIIVDDGSNKGFKENQFKKYKNGNIIFIYLDKNLGIESALNRGLEYLVKNHYKYVARLDCGDLCCEGRIEKQIKVLKSNPNIKLVGSNVSFFDELGVEKFVYKVPTGYKTILKQMYLRVMFIHPSIMINIDIIEKIGYYPYGYKAAEDYAFFFKIIKNFEATNLDEILVKCEINKDGISSKKRNIQLLSKLKVIMKYFYFGFYPICGVIYTVILLIIPKNIVFKIKKLSNVLYK